GVVGQVIAQRATVAGGVQRQRDRCGCHLGLDGQGQGSRSGHSGGIRDRGGGGMHAVGQGGGRGGTPAPRSIGYCRTQRRGSFHERHGAAGRRRADQGRRGVVSNVVAYRATVAGGIQRQGDWSGCHLRLDRQGQGGRGTAGVAGGVHGRGREVMGAV